MKHRSFLFVLALILAGAPSVVRADPNEPMFAPNLIVIHGMEYIWYSADEDNLSHTDHYTKLTGPDVGAVVNVTGRIEYPNLAAVSGYSGTINGHLVSGVYGDNVQSSSTTGSWTFAGQEYTAKTGNYTYYPELSSSGQLLSSGSETYTSEDGSYTYVHSW